MPTLRRFQFVCEAVEQRFHRQGQQLVPLLDEGGDGGGGLAKAVHQLLSQAPAPEAEQGGDQRFYAQLPPAGKVAFRVSGKAPRLPPDLSDQGRKAAAKFLHGTFHGWPS